MIRIKSSLPVYQRVITVCLGTFIVGYHIAIFNSCMSVITKLNQWDLLNQSDRASNQGTLTSILSIGAFIGSFFADKLVQQIQSIRKGLIYADFVGIIGVVIAITSPQFGFQVLGRFIAGFIAGINTCLVMSYIKEFSPTEISGSTGSCNQISIVIGIFFSFLCGLALPQTEDELYNYSDKIGWRIILGLPIIFHVLRIIILSFFFTLDAPSYLQKRQQKEKFFQYIQQVYKLEYQEQVISEFEQMYITNTLSQQNDTNDNKLLFQDAIYRKKLILGIIFTIAQQLSGINAIMFYSNSIFLQYGMQSYATLITSLIGIIQIIATVFCGYVVDKLGRKSLNQFGFSIIILCLFNLVLSNYVYNSQISVIISIFMHIIGFSISLGPIMFIYVSETLNRAGISVIIAINWCFTIIIGYFFPSLVIYLSIGGVFLLFGIFSLLCFIYLQIFMVETKGKSQDEINMLFAGTQQQNNKNYNIQFEEKM